MKTPMLYETATPSNPTRFGTEGIKWMLFCSNRESHRRYCAVDRIQTAASTLTLKMPFSKRQSRARA